MSNWGIEDDTNLAGNNDALPGPKALRDAYEAMKTQNQQLQEGLATVQKELTRQKVAGTLSELGIPATAAEQYKGDADPAKVREWATTMQSIFGGGSGQPNNTPPVPPVVTDGDAQNQFQRMNEAGQSGTPLGNTEAAFGRVNDATDTKGLVAAWQNMN